MMKEIFVRNGVDETAPVREPSVKTAEKLVERAVNGKRAGLDDGEVNEENRSSPSQKKESCPYATRRAIVESFEEIRRFAEENKLASKVVSALLTFLAEAAINALRGKVSGKVLEVLLNGFTFHTACREAFKEGEKAGKNAKIETEFFPAQETELPDINGGVRENARDTIFDIAKGGR